MQCRPTTYSAPENSDLSSRLPQYYPRFQNSPLSTPPRPVLSLSHRVWNGRCTSGRKGRKRRGGYALSHAVVGSPSPSFGEFVDFTRPFPPAFQAANCDSPQNASHPSAIRFVTESLCRAKTPQRNEHTHWLVQACTHHEARCNPHAAGIPFQGVCVCRLITTRTGTASGTDLVRCVFITLSSEPHAQGR